MPTIHAPDGGVFGHALCQEPTGDVSHRERDVTCGDCLDLVDNADQALTIRLRRAGWEPEVNPAAAVHAAGMLAVTAAPVVPAGLALRHAARAGRP